MAWTADVKRETSMIDLYAWGTTNGRRALIMAEEVGLPFTLHQIDIRLAFRQRTALSSKPGNRETFQEKQGGDLSTNRAITERD
jgi:hypothetical protein